MRDPGPVGEPGFGNPLPTLRSVREAAERLRGIANRTPTLTSRTLDARTGGSIFLKCECFQRSGSFKFRGAYNAAASLPDSLRARGILTYSSGNHAQAMALVGRTLGLSVTVVMPPNAPAAKREATRTYGAEIITYDPKAALREDVARELAREQRSTLIPPFDHPDVVSGQGTAALELFEDSGPFDVLLVPCGGGGLLSGSALAATSTSGCRVIGVEPEVADDATKSFRSGTLHAIRNPPTIADGLRTPSLGTITWPLVRDHVSEMRTVSEDEIAEAMRFLWTRMKLVVEPSGAVALAALLKDDQLARDRRVGVLVSGGNVDLDAACRILSSL
ncbi:MAG: threo-3-hydroxy-L-aspartate ammonia-lyase [Gemmatimonas sp.]|nr:threo-3-hydroxy-L-aspartate ammonia-lyase [Gemmatimonas sp.]